MKHAIDSRERKLDDYFTRAKKRLAEEELASDLARLGAVLACGYVERCVEIIILERLSFRAQERVLKFVRGHFKKGTNYDCEAIGQLLERFDTDWANKFRAILHGNEEWETSLTSLYALRNSIAHGGEQNRSLTGVEALYHNCKYIVIALVDATK